MIITCSDKIAMEAQHGLIAQILKDIIFSLQPGATAQVEEVIDSTMVIG